MRKFLGVAALATAMSLTAAAQAQYLIIGNDEKVAFDDGKQVLSFFGTTRCRVSAFASAAIASAGWCNIELVRNSGVKVLAMSAK
jgi:hypothetical protein